ncbi:MAG: hypothetical protein M9913_18625 [Bryobacteraceae bacterium]|nr:hypothetical protein [Solibacteraceae bacterium]MCL4840697.1 hypothetical protein [Bryobacteraceae bacterium]MCO5352877.1 hypothetical protein [Bryobacteraceae bacterium]
MRYILGLALMTVCCFGQSQTEYVFGFLRANPKAEKLERERVMEIQKGHIAHLGKMARDGILVAAGPLGTSTDLRGIVIFKGVTVEQARAAAAEDPAVANGRLVLDVWPWTGPAGIGERVAKAMKDSPNGQVPMVKRAFVVYWRTPEMPESLGEVAAEHGEFLRKLRAGGDVLALGALRGSKEFLGVAVYRGEDVEERVKFCREEDPLVKRGWVKPEGLVWWVAEETFAAP